MLAMRSPTRGFIVAAPASGSGKTTITLALLALLKRRGLAVASAKVGPDFIDPAFHALTTGRPCYNLDGWAMRRGTLAALVARASDDADILVVEGVMGLFDGAPNRERLAPGSTAEIAHLTGLPVVLVLPAKGQGGTAGAVLSGLAHYHPRVRIAGVIFNGVGSERHREILNQAAAQAEIPVIGHVPHFEELGLPSRHLGLVQASEHPNLRRFMQSLADRIGPCLDLDLLTRISALPEIDDAGATLGPPPIPPLAQRIAVARDVAYDFAYPAILESWRVAGAEISSFSPLQDEAPLSNADAVFLPGGYPELHAGKLAANRNFLEGLRDAARKGAVIYGECGGYMTLGLGLIDAKGERHAMAGLLPVVTSFAARKMHLGYREAKLLENGPLGSSGQIYRGHEFHYATVMAEADCPALFSVHDSVCRDLGTQGRRQGSVLGSFLHLIDRA